MKTIILLITLSAVFSGCAPLPGCLTVDINGFVIDKISKEPVNGALVMSREYSDLTAVTDENGHFFLKRKNGLILVVFIGDRITINKLLVQKDGYKDKSFDCMAWPDCGPINPTIELEPETNH